MSKPKTPDGKAPRKSRRKWATAPSDDIISTNRRLGFRPAEFARLTGVSPVTIWRGIRDGKIETVDHCGIKVIPRAFAISAGFITADDAI